MSLETRKFDDDRFTDRDAEVELFNRQLQRSQHDAAPETRVLAFHGVGGAGKTWLLSKLRASLRADSAIPSAILDFDPRRGGDDYRRSAEALWEIRQQLGVECPRFDMAWYATHREDPPKPPPGRLEIGWQVAVALMETGAGLPCGGVIETLGARLSHEAAAWLKSSPLGKWLDAGKGENDIRRVRQMLPQEIYEELPRFLAADLLEFLPDRGGKPCRAVVFLDTFDALAGEASDSAAYDPSEWVRDAARELGSVLFVVAGRGKLRWETKDDLNWDGARLHQRLVGGFIESDARRFLDKSHVTDVPMQDAILRVCAERPVRPGDPPGHHPMSLDLCVDIVAPGRRVRNDITPETFSTADAGFERLVEVFLRSVTGGETGAEAEWLRLLAWTPLWDKEAARAARGTPGGTDWTAAWETLLRYSFTSELAQESGWYALHARMRDALCSHARGEAAPTEPHAFWRGHWSARSETSIDDAASLAWHHRWHLEPQAALEEWDGLCGAALSAMRMAEHESLLGWWAATGLYTRAPENELEARALVTIGNRQQECSLGDRDANLRSAIGCYEAALRVYTEECSPIEWAAAQNNLGIGFANQPTGDRDGNLRAAIACYEAALRVRTEARYPMDWAATINNLGNAHAQLPSGDREGNLRDAIACYEAALRVRTEDRFPMQWATTQNNLGNAHADLPSGDRDANLLAAIACYEAALRVRTEARYPMDWATTQNNLGTAYVDLPSGDREANLRAAIACYEAALRVRTEERFPMDCVAAQNNLGNAYTDLPYGDRDANLRAAIACYEAALRVYSEEGFPRDWAMTQNNLGTAYGDLPSGDRDANLRAAIGCYEAALRVYTEERFPMDWAGTQNNLGLAYQNLSSGDRDANLRKAIACYEAALGVYTEGGFPVQLAMTLSNLGTAYADLPSGDRDANLLDAIACYEAALRVRTVERFPMDWATTRFNMGLVYEQLGRRDEAFRAMCDAQRGYRAIGHEQYAQKAAEVLKRWTNDEV